ncbi:10 TM acyl transferase domain found in Cas1p-domain-containing protein [Amylocarpus encephaloides]|uniref:10 TM acyl transferase domain found in Cas1p-domain-containing protein n=1 Tax=Amylocarpus encephaloides TaxID=45428 RepID=A0A9P8C1B9_9HELO|nr:10 TM acyl transferase domain found in Cas1p-domain-containing protein [Amylocarpus encephaloides]
MRRTTRIADAVNRVHHLLLTIVVFGIIYRYCRIDANDPFKCGALLNKGQWLDSDPRWKSENAFQNWQPPGCLLGVYKKEGIQNCFRTRRLVFVGDSTTRQIFWAVAQKMDRDRANAAIDEMLRLEDHRHMDLEFHSHGVMLQFVWDTWLNSTRLEQELKDFEAYPGKDDKSSAGLMVLGAPGLWQARHGQGDYLKGFQRSIDAVNIQMDHNIADATVSRNTFSRRGESPNIILLTPVQVPWYQDLSPSRVETITPEKINEMNNYLRTLSTTKLKILWSYSRMTEGIGGAYEDSGLHVVSNVAHQKADVALHSRCNTAAIGGYPFDGTCCSTYMQPGIAQCFIIFMAMVLPMLLVFRRRFTSLSRRLPSLEVMVALSTFMAVLGYCFYADRTHIFEKAHRHFQFQEFYIACIAVAIAGLLSVRSNESSESEFLNRPQSDEWKGWMQFLVLIYHYTHASPILWIYEIVRLVVASYLFLTGYGHTMYFLQKGDYSFKRVTTVLVRLNLMGCVLPYVMRNDYMFYYFGPLVSFWFVVVFYTLRLGRDYNSNLYFLVAKLLLSVGVVTGITMIPGVLEFVAFILKTLCNISWDVVEWRFRVFLDIYIAFFGMLLAFLVHRRRLLKAGLAPETVLDHILQLSNAWVGIFASVTTILALILIPIFFIVSHGHTKQDYNFWHPYFSIVPIISFIALRNCHQLLRKYHSTLFAWLGKFSLETYVLQYHIWLAGDGKGLLRLGLWDDWVEKVVITLLFLWVSRGVGGATQVLTTWIVDGDVRGDGGSRPGSREGIELGRLERGVLRPGGDDEDKSTGRSNKTGSGEGRSGWRLGGMLVVMWIANITYK